MIQKETKFCAIICLIKLNIFHKVVLNKNKTFFQKIATIHMIKKKV